MTVRSRRFRPFEGTPTSDLARLLVLPRYAWKEAFSAKLVVGAFSLSFVVPLGALVLVWLKHNVAALANTPAANGIPIPIDTGTMVRYGASATPTLVLVDRKGVVRFYTPTRLSESELTRRIEELLAEPG